MSGKTTLIRKWVSQFDNTNAIIFMTALNEYDMVFFDYDMLEETSDEAPKQEVNAISTT